MLASEVSYQCMMAFMVSRHGHRSRGLSVLGFLLLQRPGQRAHDLQGGVDPLLPLLVALVSLILPTTTAAVAGIADPLLAAGLWRRLFCLIRFSIILLRLQSCSRC